MKNKQWEVDKINRSKGDGDCEKCNGKGYIAYISNKTNSVAVYDCVCVNEAKVKKRIKDSGLEHQFKKQTLESYIATEEWQKIIKSSVVDYTKNNKGEWLLLSGQVGSGKTHLVVGVAQEIINSGKDVRYMSWAYEMAMLQRDLKVFNEDVNNKARKMFEDFKNVEVLIIDDFMKTRSLEYVFELINHRYINDLQTLITSEHEYERLMAIDEAIASRIYEKADKYYINIGKGEERNYRLNK